MKKLHVLPRLSCEVHDSNAATESANSKLTCVRASEPARVPSFSPLSFSRVAFDLSVAFAFAVAVSHRISCLVLIAHAQVHIYAGTV